jgi:hypothetical protein
MDKARGRLGMTREDPYKWFAATVADMRSRLERIDDLKDALIDVRGEAESPDGTIAVTVGPRGSIKSLDIRRSAYRLPPTELADTIVETIRVASLRAADNLADLLAPVMGDGDTLRSRITGERDLDAGQIRQSRDTLRETARSLSSREGSGR